MSTDQSTQQHWLPFFSSAVFPARWTLRQKLWWTVWTYLLSERWSLKPARWNEKSQAYLQHDVIFNELFVVFFYINCYLRIQLPLVLVRGGQAEKNIGREKIKKENPLSKKPFVNKSGRKGGGGRANQKRSATISWVFRWDPVGILGVIFFECGRRFEGVRVECV